MNVLNPFTRSIQESKRDVANWDKDVSEMNVSDEDLIEYVKVLLKAYRTTVDEFFEDTKINMDFYTKYPYTIQIVRIGPNGVIIGYRPATDIHIQVVRPTDFNPPLSFNLMEIQKQLDLPFLTFNFSVREYSKEEGRKDGISMALRGALDAFWQVVSSEDFEKICLALLYEEGFKESDDVTNIQNQDFGFDLIKDMYISEPAGFRRHEQWAFQFKHYKNERVTALNLQQVEEYLTTIPSQPDIVCFVTSGDLTSIGRNISVKNNRIRIWDRSILSKLAHDHLDVIKDYFLAYSEAIFRLSGTQDYTVDKWETRLMACLPGQSNFKQYEELGTELWVYLFDTALGEPRSQVSTQDGTQRRDVLFRNNQTSRFWQRVAKRFDADFLIVDFKNYKDEIEPDILDDVQKYTNDNLGRFIVLVSRKGSSSKVLPHQIRYLNNRKTAILSVSDTQLLEMLNRKISGEDPADVLEDLLDDLLSKA